MGFAPNMAVVALVHTIHEFGLHMRGREANGGGETSDYHQSEAGGN